MKKIFAFLALLFTIKCSFAQNVHLQTNDLGQMQMVDRWVPALGLTSSSDSVSHYLPTYIDSMPNVLTNATGAYMAWKYGGWLTSLTTGGWIKAYVPHGVIIGNSIPEGKPWRHSGVYLSNLNISDSAGQIGYYLTRALGYPCYNAGVGGQTTTQIRARFREAVLGIAENPGDGTIYPTSQNKAVYCIIEGSSNDPFGSVPLAQTKENILWMVRQCAEYQIPCIVLNCIGQGLSASYSNISLVQPYLNQIQGENTWMASGELQRAGAVVVDINSFWNSGVDGGLSSYNNDNFHFSSFVNVGDGAHFTQVGYDSVAVIIMRHANLPICDSIRFVSVTDPSNPPASFTRATAANITTTANFGTGTQTNSNNFSIPNTAIADVALPAAMLTDTPKITITTPSSGVSGFSNIFFHITNNPTHRPYITQKASFVGMNSGFFSVDSLLIQMCNTANGIVPFKIQYSANGAYASAVEVVSSGASTVLAVNRLSAAATLAAPIDAYTSNNTLVGFATNGGVSAPGTNNQLYQFQFTNTTPNTTGIGLSLIANTFGFWNGASNIMSASLFSFNDWATRSTTGPIVSSNSLNMGIMYSNVGVANITGLNDTLSGVLFQPVYNDTTSNKIPGWLSGVTILQTPTATQNDHLVGVWQAYGDNWLNTKNGRTLVGDSAGVALGTGRLEITDSLRGLIIPRLTLAQRNKMGYLKSITVTAGGSGFGATLPKVNVAVSSGIAPRAWCNVSAGAINSCAILDPGAGLNGVTPTITLTNTTGTGYTLTPVMGGPDPGTEIYLIDSSYNEFWNGSWWVPETSGASTLEQVLTAGGTLANNHTIAVGSHSLIFTGSSPSANVIFQSGAVIDGLYLNQNTQSSNYTMQGTDDFLQVNANSGNVTITLGSVTAGKVFYIKRVDGTGNTVSISGTIDGAGSYSLTAQYKYVTLMSLGGGAYNIIGNN